MQNVCKINISANNSLEMWSEKNDRFIKNNILLLLKRDWMALIRRAVTKEAFAFYLRA